MSASGALTTLCAQPNGQASRASAAKPGDTPRRIAALDALRAFAITWVILHHVVRAYVPSTDGSFVVKFCRMGNAGVNLFFVLSGCLIGGILLSELRASGGLQVPRFWYRRWMRTLPAYYATLAIIVAIDYLHLHPREQPLTNLWSYVLFLQTYANDPDALRFTWSWSLCIEEWFYVLFPLYVWAGRKLFRSTSPEFILRSFAFSAFAFSVASRAYTYDQLCRAGLASSGNSYLATCWMVHNQLDGLAVGVFLSTLPRPRLSTGLLAGVGVGILALVWLTVRDSPLWFEYQISATFALVFGTITYAGLADCRFNRFKIPRSRLYRRYFLQPLPHSSNCVRRGSRIGNRSPP
jgi:peptidoglycan/LPS O-acetylase OafA/YrhL